MKKTERIIKEIFTCIICFDVFVDPMNIKNCMHKFCKKCIEDYNRKVKKECPSCKEPIETRRVLREDIKTKDLSKFFFVKYFI